MAGESTNDSGGWIRAALDRFEGPLILYATRLAGDGSAARDVVQDVFLRLCAQDRAKVEPRLAPWLFAVCRNRALDERRRRRGMHHATARSDVETLATLDAPGATAEETAERRDATTQALQAVDALPEAQQEVVRLKFRHGLSYREIAEVTGLSVSHVGVRIHEAIKALRGRLGASAPAMRATEGGLR